MDFLAINSRRKFFLNKYVYAGEILLAILVGCSSSVDISSPSATSRNAGTQVGNPEVLTPAKAVIDPTVKNILTPTRNSPSQGQTIVPEIVQICPVEPEVELTELGVSPNFPLILLPFEDDPSHASRNIFAVSWVDGSLTEFSIIPELGDNWMNYSIGMNHSGEKLSYSLWNDDFLKQTIWVSSLDGTEQYPVAEIWFAESFGWMSDEEIVVIGMHNKELYETDQWDWWDERIPLEIISSSSGERRPLPPLPEGSYLTNFFQIGRKYYAIYQPGPYSVEFLMYDYAEKRSFPIVQWFQGEIEPGNLDGPIFFNPNGLIDIVRDRPSYGKDIALGLDLESLQKDVEYDQVMSKLLLPGNFGFRESYLSPSGNLSHLYMILNYGYEDGVDLSPIYLFDSARNELIDHCFNYDERAFSFWHNVSPDGQFVTFSFFEKGSSEIPKEVIILNMNTGYFARIQDLKVVGWGVQSEN